VAKFANIIAKRSKMCSQKRENVELVLLEPESAAGNRRHKPMRSPNEGRSNPKSFAVPALPKSGDQDSRSEFEFKISNSLLDDIRR
jgi:hypothetical protein